jgi:hypothetical protein
MKAFCDLIVTTVTFAKEQAPEPPFSESSSDLDKDKPIRPTLSLLVMRYSAMKYSQDIDNGLNIAQKRAEPLYIKVWDQPWPHQQPGSISRLISHPPATPCTVQSLSMRTKSLLQSTTRPTTSTGMPGTSISQINSVTPVSKERRRLPKLLV